MRTAHRQKRQTIAARTDRRGAATVEFALIAPIFVMLVLGVAEFGEAFNATTDIDAAVRDAGRLASMGRPDTLPANQSFNTKVTNDVLNVLEANGYNRSALTVTITHADGSQAGSAFNLDDSANDMQLFRISVLIPYNQISIFPLRFLKDSSLNSSLVFRMGNSVLQ